jgi:hypothetical protein
MNLKVKAYALAALAVWMFICNPAWADETDLIWSTFLGGSGQDYGLDIAVDGSGNAYVTGTTQSVDFPATAGVFDDTYNGGGEDVYVAKLDATGTVLVCATFLGGSDSERSNSITTDDSGNPYLTGHTRSADFPTTAGAFDAVFRKGEAFVTKLSPDFSTLSYSTFLGGKDNEFGYEIDVDASGRAYIIGQTQSTDFPVTTGAFDDTFNGVYDVFVARLSASGGALDYATFLGGRGSDHGDGIFVDDIDNAYLTGYTKSRDFPTTAGAFDTTHGGGYDVFVAKLNATGSALLYATFLGGGYYDCGSSIAALGSGEACVTGWTRSPDFPTTAEVYDRTYNDDYDVFVVRLNATGGALDYATFLGGRHDDRGYDICVDNLGSAYIIGRTGTSTMSSDFPTTPGAFDTTFNGSKDGIMAKFSPTGGLEYCTFLGGTDGDVGYGIALSEDGDVYVTGRTWSDDFPITPGAFDTAYNDFEAFVARLDLSGIPEASPPPLAGLPKTYGLSWNYPHTLNDSTDAEIRYQIPRADHVTLRIFNTLGQEVRTLVRASQKAGVYVVVWDGTDEEGRELASGLYFCRLRAGDFSKAIKMVLMR